jgi:hypothetical protein
MPKSKNNRQSNFSFDKKSLKRMGIVLSLFINVVAVVVVIVTWADWHNGNVTFLTGDIEQSTCFNYFTRQIGPVSAGGFGHLGVLGKTTTVGDVIFQPVYLSAKQLSSPCQVNNQLAVFSELTQTNDSAATTYYNSLFKEYPPSHYGQKIEVPIYYNSETKQPTQTP